MDLVESADLNWLDPFDAEYQLFRRYLEIYFRFVEPFTDMYLNMLKYSAENVCCSSIKNIQEPFWYSYNELIVILIKLREYSSFLDFIIFKTTNCRKYEIFKFDKIF